MRSRPLSRPSWLELGARAASPARQSFTVQEKSSTVLRGGRKMHRKRAEDAPLAESQSQEPQGASLAYPRLLETPRPPVVPSETVCGV